MKNWVEGMNGRRGVYRLALMGRRISLQEPETKFFDLSNCVLN